MKPAISPKPCYYDPLTGGFSSKRKTTRDIYFASTLELDLFLVLSREFSRDRIVLQVELMVKPETILYPALFWRCDFRVYGAPRSGVRNYVNVEAKGFKTEEFRLKLQFLELYNPTEYERLVLIGGQKPLKIDSQQQTVDITTGIKRIKQMLGE